MISHIAIPKSPKTLTFCPSLQGLDDRYEVKSIYQKKEVSHDISQ